MFHEYSDESTNLEYGCKYCTSSKKCSSCELSFNGANTTIKCVYCVHCTDLAIQRICFSIRKDRSMFCELCFFRALYGRTRYAKIPPVLEGLCFK